MRRCVLTFALLLAGGAFSTQSTAKAEEEVRKGWHHNYADAYREATRLGRPLVVHVYTDWCGPCRQMESSVLNTTEVTARLGRSIVGVKLNADHHSQLVSRFGVSGYPSDVFVGPDGRILFRSSGFSSSREYAAQMARANEQVAVHLLANAGAPPADNEAAPALEGFSPVAITRDRAWEKGSGEFAWEYAGAVYHLQNAEELEVFRNNPQQYIPELSGNDPLELSHGHRDAPGDIRYGVFFRGKLYLLASAENRKQFMSKPQRIADAAEKLRTVETARRSPSM
jgi:YHS domain-containing protein/thiol-disulfide isomerase/thioredoxin